MQWEEQSIIFLSKKIFYRAAGNGPVLVFLHGFMASSEIMLSLATHFVKSYKVICPDLPGHGQSECIGEIHIMELMADAVRAILTAENIETANLCGHSMGGYVALSLVNKYPQLCQSLVLLNSHPFEDTEEKKNQRKREISIIGAQRKNILVYLSVQSYFVHKPNPLFQSDKALINRIGSQTTSEGMVAALKGMVMRSSSILVMLKNTFPLLWIMGEIEMNNFPFSKFRFENQGILEKIVVIKKAGHLCFLEEEKEVYLYMENFFKAKQFS